ncbi:MAG: GTPase HflX [Candidatus Geothermincolia bacterium]
MDDEHRGGNDPEVAVLAAAQLPAATDEETSESLKELEALAKTAGASVSASVVQKRSSYDPATLLGRGKLDEVRSEVDKAGASLVIFDNELSIGQQDRLSTILDARVIDRTALILDIFAQHAHTAEGRTQVELAQYSYLLPRIRGRGIELSRMAGGIGTRRGPGETKLEVDRRRIRKRMHKLERDLEQMEAVRQTQRKQRVRVGLPSVCLVGYTNSGKSSLLNRLTGSTVLVEDQLFSTLDSTTRRLELPDGLAAVVTDTVGFIRKLPHELVAAFHSTLEVVRDADLLLHLVDATREETMAARMEAVAEVLSDLGAAEIPTIVAMNKVDAIEQATSSMLRERYPDAIQVSAATGKGMDRLVAATEEILSESSRLTLRIPAARGDVISRLYRDGSVLSRELDDETIVMVVSLPRDRVPAYAAYMAGHGK